MLAKNSFLRLSEERRNKLIDIAMDIYINNPYEDITIRMIVKEMNININTFYRYFDEKDDLYIYIYNMLEEKIEPIDTSLLFISFQNIDGIYSEKELQFLNNTWNLPKYMIEKIIAENLDKYKNIYKSHLREEKYNGNLREDVDEDLIAYMYASTVYNLYLYFKENNITNIDLITKIREYFYYSFFNYGIMKR